MKLASVISSVTIGVMVVLFSIGFPFSLPACAQDTWIEYTQKAGTTPTYKRVNWDDVAAVVFVAKQTPGGPPVGAQIWVTQNNKTSLLGIVSAKSSSEAKLRRLVENSSWVFGYPKIGGGHVLPEDTAVGYFNLKKVTELYRISEFGAPREGWSVRFGSSALGGAIIDVDQQKRVQYIFDQDPAG